MQRGQLAQHAGHTMLLSAQATAGHASVELAVARSMCFCTVQAPAGNEIDVSNTVCCLAIPADMSVAHFCSFIGAYLSEVRAIQVCSTWSHSLQHEQQKCSGQPDLLLSCIASFCLSDGTQFADVVMPLSSLLPTLSNCLNKHTNSHNVPHEL